MSTALSPGLTGRLAAFAVSHPASGIPSEIRQQSVRFILNGFGTALGATGDRGIAGLVDTLVPYGGAGTATLIGRDRRTDMLTASFVNGAAVNAFDFDDTHHDTIIHPTAPVLPALLALAEQETISGSDLIDAFVIGTEIECRLGVGVSPTHYKRGWHITSTCGVFGAAAACGRLLGLDERQMAWAFGNASAQASGLVETLGSMAKSVGVGGAARGGLMAALLARNGVEGPPLPLEGARGFLVTFSDSPNPDVVIDGLGSRWELMNNVIKPYPCGVVLNPVIDACFDLRGRPDFTVAAIERIEIVGNALLRDRTDRPDVASGRTAQVSAQHAAAVALLRGTAGIADFDEANVRDPAVDALRGRVAPIMVDETIPLGAARVRVVLADGAALEAVVTEARGSPARPPSDADLETKVRALAAYGCPALDPEPLIAALWALDATPSAGDVMAAARP